MGVDTFYDKLWKDEWYGSHNYDPTSASIKRILLKVIEKNCTGKSLIDVGCGEGRLLDLIRKNFDLDDISGADFSKEALNLAEKKGLDVFNADLTDINTFPPKKWDLVICSEVLEHIDDDILALQNLRKLMNENSKLIITVPYSMKYWSRSDKFAGHVRRYEFEEITNKLEDNGFQISQIFVWGALFYSNYHSFTQKFEPGKIKSKVGKSKSLISIMGKVLFYLFYLDDPLIFSNKGRRLFLVAQRKN